MIGHPDTNPSSPQEATRDAEPSAACELCGGPVWTGPYTHAVFDAADVYACNACIEDMLDASALDARSEVGLVGGRS